MHYAGGNDFLLFINEEFVYSKFSFWSLPVLINEENIIKIKGKENEKTNSKAINCLIRIIGFLIKSSPHNPHTNLP